MGDCYVLKKGARLGAMDRRNLQKKNTTSSLRRPRPWRIPTHQKTALIREKIKNAMSRMEASERDAVVTSGRVHVPEPSFEGKGVYVPPRNLRRKAFPRGGTGRSAGRNTFIKGGSSVVKEGLQLR